MKLVNLWARAPYFCRDSMAKMEILQKWNKFKIHTCARTPHFFLAHGPVSNLVPKKVGELALVRTLPKHFWTYISLKKSLFFLKFQKSVFSAHARETFWKTFSSYFIINFIILKFYSLSISRNVYKTLRNWPIWHKLHFLW